jgi:type II secretion system protein G
MEMLIVLTIIGLLMGMVIYHLSGVSEMAQQQKAQSDLLSFKELLAAYQLESGSLPTTEQGLKALWENPTAGRRCSTRRSRIRGVIRTNIFIPASTTPTATMFGPWAPTA